MIETLGLTGVSTGVTIGSVYLILKYAVIPKLNAVCVRTLRMEITQDVLLDVACEDHPDEDLRGRILDDIERAGIPRQGLPLKPI